MSRSVRRQRAAREEAAKAASQDSAAAEAVNTEEGAPAASGTADAAAPAKDANSDAATANIPGEAGADAPAAGEQNTPPGEPAAEEVGASELSPPAGAEAAAAFSATEQPAAPAGDAEGAGDGASDNQGQEPPADDPAGKRPPIPSEENPWELLLGKPPAPKEPGSTRPQTAEERDEQAEAACAAARQKQQNSGDEISPEASPAADATLAAGGIGESLNQQARIAEYTADLQRMNKLQLNEQLAIMKKRLAEQIDIAAQRKQQVDSGQGAHIEQAMNIALAQESDNLVAFHHLQLIQIHRFLGGEQITQARPGAPPSKAFPAAASSAGPTESEPKAASAAAAGAAWDAMAEENDQDPAQRQRHQQRLQSRTRPRQDADRQPAAKARRTDARWPRAHSRPARNQESSDEVIQQPNTIFARTADAAERATRISECLSVLATGWQIGGPESEYRERKMMATLLPLGKTDKPVPEFTLQHQRKPAPGLAHKHRDFVRLWLDAGHQCCPLPQCVTPFHTKVGKRLQYGTIATEWPAIVLGLLPEPPEQRDLIDLRAPEAQPLAQYHPSTHEIDGATSIYIGYNPEVKDPMFEQSPYRAWLELLEQAQSPAGLSLSQAWEFRGILCYFAHCAVQYCGGFGEDTMIPGLFYDPRFVLKQTPPSSRVYWKARVVCPLNEDLPPQATIHALPTPWHGADWKIFFSEQEMVQWRMKYVPNSNPDAWYGWQKLSMDNRSPNMLCKQCGWAWIPFGRAKFLWIGDMTPCPCEGFCPNLACPFGPTGGTPPPDMAIAERAARLAEPTDRQTTPIARLSSFPGVPNPDEQRPAPSHDEKRAQHGRLRGHPTFGRVFASRGEEVPPLPQGGRRPTCNRHRSRLQRRRTPPRCEGCRSSLRLTSAPPSLQRTRPRPRLSASAASPPKSTARPRPTGLQWRFQPRRLRRRSRSLARPRRRPRLSPRPRLPARPRILPLPRPSPPPEELLQPSPLPRSSLHHPSRRYWSSVSSSRPSSPIREATLKR